MDDDFQRRLDQILLDIKGLEDLIRDIQSPKKSSEKEVKEKIKVGPETIGRRMCTDRSSHLIWKSYMNREFGDNFWSGSYWSSVREFLDKLILMAFLDPSKKPKPKVG